MQYYLGMGYTEAYNIPVSYRTWFIKRINKEIDRTNKEGDGQSRAAHHNTPDIREMQGRARSQVPAKLRRFT